MIICAFDPGTHCTGYGVLDIERNSVKHIAHGTIKPKAEGLSERLKEIHLSVKSILEEYKPVEAAIETSFYAVNAQTALKLGQARGVIILAATLMDLPVFEYTPTEIKKATCGYGHAGKNQISDMVAMLLGIKKNSIASKDATDALAVGICHGASRRIRSLTP
jgi:crossover junction endodeoxyribonuclease RuvC